MKLTSKKGSQNLRYFSAFVSLVVLLLASWLSLAASADTIVRGFNAATTLNPGWIVALVKDRQDTVELAPQNDPSRIYGVVIDPSKAPVTLQPQQGRRVFVATSGTYPVLVTTSNGKINPGDYLSTSNADGIAAKATQYQDTILGQALEKFDGVNNVISRTGGKSIGLISTSIAPARNPQEKNEAQVPSLLRRAGQAIAGKNVSAARIYAGLVVFLVAAVIAISVLIIGIRSGMISIGRNPLSRQSIIRGLFQVTLVAVAVFAIGVFAVYLLLKL